MQALWVSVSLGFSRLDVFQPQYNLIERVEFERELRSVCTAYGLEVIPYGLLAGGFLTGKYRRGQPIPVSRSAEGLKHTLFEKNFSLLDAIDAIAQTHKATAPQVALAWLLADPIIFCTIIGATSLEQLNENIEALDLQLPEKENKNLTALTRWDGS